MHLKQNNNSEISIEANEKPKRCDTLVLKSFSTNINKSHPIYMHSNLLEPFNTKTMP